ncbi:MAG: serine hydrolase domain-containing protein [Sediminibacterium sp.]
MQQNKLLKFKMVAAFGLLPFFIAAQVGYQPPYFQDSNRVEKLRIAFPVIEKMVEKYAADNHFPGYSFGIVLDGKLVFTKSGGYTNLQSKTAATTGSMFRIASMSKSFTAMAIVKLRDEGKLNLEDAVSKYIPELKNQGLTTDAAPITIRDLLTHSAGFPEDNPWGDRQLEKTSQEFLAFIKKGIHFSTASGTSYEYSNVGFTMLGYIIEKVTGKNYGAYIKENIWKPLNMEASWEFSSITEAKLAHGYRWMNNSWTEEPLLHDGIYGAMGGMITSVESFSKYVSLHLDAWPPRNNIETGPVKRSSIREMHQPSRFIGLNANYKYPSGRACATTAAYGYGLSWLKDCTGRTSIAHSGGLPGFGSNWRILPEFGLGVILLANVTYAPTALFNTMVIDTLLRMGTVDLQPRILPASATLKNAQAKLTALLPSWKNAAASNLFAENFFDDYKIDALIKEATSIFDVAGAIHKTGDMIPENELRGYYYLHAKNGTIKISFTLTPTNPSQIQEYHISFQKQIQE